MQIILENYTENAELEIEKGCRTCYSSWHRFNPPESTKELIQKVIRKAHMSVLEHSSATFRIKEISRVCSHELVRHRLFSYSQESQRYVCYADKPGRGKTKDFKFITPDSIGIPVYSCAGTIISKKDIIKASYYKLAQAAYTLYESMLAEGIPPEDARYILPQATTTEIVVTGNLRTWREFLYKRCHPRAHWEIRQMANQIKDILIEKFPNVFFDFKLGEMTEEEIERVNK